MKKLLGFLAVISFLVFSTSLASASLWDYFQEQGQNLPSASERSPLADSCHIQDYRGQYAQNLALEACLRGPDGFLGATLPVAGATYILAGSGVTGSGTSISLQTLTLPQSGYELLDADFSTTFYVTLEPGSRTRQEIASCTTVTQNADNTATLSNCTRGLLPISPYTASTTYQFAHAGGTSVIFSDPPQLFNEFGVLAEDETVTGEWIFGTTTSKGLCFINTNFCIRSNSTTLQWTNDDWVNAYNLNTSTASALTASSSQGINITDAQVLVIVSTTQGMAFGVDGRIYQQVSSTRGLVNNSQGTYITTTANLTFNSGGALDVVGSSTPGVANSLVITSSTGRINPYFIATSTISSTFADPFLRSTSTGAYWATTTLVGITATSTMNQTKVAETAYYNSSTVSVLVIIDATVSSDNTQGGSVDFFLDTTSTAMYRIGTLSNSVTYSAANESARSVSSFIIPPGWYFKVTITTAGDTGGAINRWNEIPLF